MMKSQHPIPEPATPLPPCPCCGEPVGHPPTECALGALVSVLRQRDNHTEDALQAIWAATDVDGLWDDLGPLLDRLETGYYRDLDTPSTDEASPGSWTVNAAGLARIQDWINASAAHPERHNLDAWLEEAESAAGEALGDDIVIEMGCVFTPDRNPRTLILSRATHFYYQEPTE